MFKVGDIVICVYPEKTHAPVYWEQHLRNVLFRVRMPEVVHDKTNLYLTLLGRSGYANCSTNKAAFIHASSLHKVLWAKELKELL